jgi:protein-glucosylgalactosylhydroxylysine glucosidase
MTKTERFWSFSFEFSDKILLLHKRRILISNLETLPLFSTLKIRFSIVLSKNHPFLMKNYLFCLFLFFANALFSQKIDRKAVVERHTVVLTKADTLASLSVGNGVFCFTADITGLQTFPNEYAKGIPLGTQSEWGWHSFPNKGGYKIEESLKEYASHGRTVPYGVQANSSERNKLTVNYLRQNPHRLQLGNLGLYLTKKDGTEAKLNDLTDIRQTLNMWTGELNSHFVFDGQSVDVLTFCHQNKDMICAKIKSKLVQTGQLKIRLRFPYPTDKFLDEANNYENEEKHSSKILSNSTQSPNLQSQNLQSPTSNLPPSVIEHILDSTSYLVRLHFGKNKAILTEKQKHDFILTPSVESDVFELNAHFFEQVKYFTVKNAAKLSRTAWQQFWKSGGAIDFSGSTDPRAFELERRVILSQYLTKIQCTGTMPPQETGLTYNSWFGKPHLEMHWWHAAHFAQWGRVELMERSLNWYKKVLPEARRIAERQGFEGVRWQKMTDPNGHEAPSSVGAFLIWQQPHFIYFAEQVFQSKSHKKTLEQYKDLVFATADFMASYAYFDPEKQRFILGKALIPAQERFKPEETFNPTYELAYWHWALTIAQKWRERLGLPPSEKYARVLEKLSPLPVGANPSVRPPSQDGQGGQTHGSAPTGIYLAAESAPDSYSNEKYLTDHPSVLGAFGMLPKTPLLDSMTMKRTLDKVWEVWHWDDTWGWDFPMTAMTAARLGLPDKAVDALLMPIKTNAYLPNGHNYQDDRLRLYLPGNGGVLLAVALLCTENAFPKDGTWRVKWEKLSNF